MQELTWLEDRIGTMDDAKKIINQFYWNITWKQLHGQWVAWGGDKVIFRSDSEDALYAFIYGMALAYRIFSPDEIQRFHEEHNYE